MESVHIIFGRRPLKHVHDELHESRSLFELLLIRRRCGFVAGFSDESGRVTKYLKIGE